MRGEGKKVFILTDTNAASCGDITPHWFRNNDSVDPGDIGFGVRSFIVGDIDGRFFGWGTALDPLFTNASHNLTYQGEPFSAYRVGVERSVQVTRAGENAYQFPNQNPAIKPDILLNMDIENTFWLDVGTKGTYPKNPVDGGTDPLILPLSTGVTQPVYSDPFTWRDRALEACLMTAIPEGCFSGSELCKQAKRSIRVKDRPLLSFLKTKPKVSKQVRPEPRIK